VLIDARTVPKNKELETDVCIVGAGAAGITLAKEFIGARFRVCLLESGGLEFNQETQSLYKGENIGLPYFPLEAARLRFFGGSTNHWAGQCAPLDEVDFQVRDWIPYSGWPFLKSHLDPFYKRAQSICQLGPYQYDANFWNDAIHGPPLRFVDDRVLTTFFQHSSVRFGVHFRDEVARADNIRVYLHANVVNIETNPTAKKVLRLKVACLEGPEFWMAAKIFILATGGLENPRLLLVSNKVQSAGLGNQNDLVGRFFMEHLDLIEGAFLPSNPYLPIYLYVSHSHPNQKVPVTGALTLAPKVQRRERLMGIGVLLRPTWSKGVEPLKDMIEAVHEKGLGDIAKHLKNVLSNLTSVSQAIYGRVRHSRYPVDFLTLDNQSEQSPNPQSRVMLSTERDRLNQNRIQLDWRLNSIDKRTIWRAHEIIAQELGRAGLGRLRVALDHEENGFIPALNGGFHHMGTTRMHNDPKKGVVDANCRLHGVGNLFIAGSSVFPTSGWTNPTLTIVALAIRLADHLKENFQ
jgi:choline dehydrogenase-like flavoprotein